MSRTVFSLRAVSICQDVRDDALLDQLPFVVGHLGAKGGLENVDGLARDHAQHFVPLDERDEVLSMISRESIDGLKTAFRAEVSNDEWQLIKKCVVADVLADTDCPQAEDRPGHRVASHRILSLPSYACTC